MNKVYIYIIGMALVTYLIRVLPLTLIRKKIKNKTKVSPVKCRYISQVNNIARMQGKLRGFSFFSVSFFIKFI